MLLAHYLLCRGDRSISSRSLRPPQRPANHRVFQCQNIPNFFNRTRDEGTGSDRIAGLETAVRAIGLEMSGTVFHQPNGKTRLKFRKKPLVTLDRTNLVLTLLDELIQKYDNSRLNLHFDRTCTASAAFFSRTVSNGGSNDARISSRGISGAIAI